MSADTSTPNANLLVEYHNEGCRVYGSLHAYRSGKPDYDLREGEGLVVKSVKSPVIANIRKTWKHNCYHHPHCRVCPALHNQKLYDTIELAEADGFIGCEMCKGFFNWPNYILTRAQAISANNVVVINSRQGNFENKTDQPAIRELIERFIDLFLELPRREQEILVTMAQTMVDADRPHI